MAERPTFGDKLPSMRKTAAYKPAASMFAGGEELPLFSGTPIPAVERPYVPQDRV
jgi:hypothetical protein